MTAGRLAAAGARGAAIAATGALLGLVLAVAGARSGSVAVLAPVALVGGVVLLVSPRAALIALFGSTVLWEGAGGFLPFDSRFYDSVGFALTLTDLLVFAFIASVVLDSFRHRRALIGAGPLTWPLVVLVAAVAAGFYTARQAGLGLKALLPAVLILSHIALLPILVANVLRDGTAVRRALAVVTGLVAFKSAIGVLLVAAGQRPLVEGAHVTYLAPTTNFLSLAFLMCTLAALLRRVSLPAWVWGTAPLALLELALSYRRSFWIGFAAGVAVVLLVGGPRGRAVFLIAVTLIGGAFAIGFAGVGGTASRGGGILARAASLSPNELTTNAEDRYRLDERKNVLAELRSHPLTGLGLQVPWAARYPLPVEHEGGRTYVHFAALWYWLNLGILGLLAYVALLAGSLVAAVRAWRRHDGTVIGAFGLGMVGAVVGLACAELTASFTGVELRFSVVFPCLLGLLLAAARVAPRG